MKHQISWLLVAALYLSCSSAETSTREESSAGVSVQKPPAETSAQAELSEASFDQKMTWEQYIGEGLEAYKRGRYSQAEKLYLAALEKAEAFGDRDPRLGSTLKNLAELPEYAEIRQVMWKRMEEYLGKTGDPRVVGDGEIFETYRRYGKHRVFPEPDWVHDD